MNAEPAAGREQALRDSSEGLLALIVVLPLGLAVIATARLARGIRSIAAWRRRWSIPERVDLLSDEEIDALFEDPEEPTAVCS